MQGAYHQRYCFGREHPPGGAPSALKRVLGDLQPKGALADSLALG
jgi:hypothetical protein